VAPSLCACTAFKLASLIETPGFLFASASTLRSRPGVVFAGRALLRFSVVTAFPPIRARARSAISGEAMRLPIQIAAQQASVRRRPARDPDGQPNRGFHSSRAFRVAGPKAPCQGRHHPQRRSTPSRICRFTAPGTSALCRAARPAALLPSATPPPDAQSPNEGLGQFRSRSAQATGATMARR
jgi:hypothetical protein